MFRRRRAFSRRPSARGGAGPLRFVGPALLGLIVLGGFFFLVNVADTTAPTRAEVRVPVQDLLKAP